MANHRYLMIKNTLLFTIHNKNGVLLSNFKPKWPYPESDQSTRNPLFTMTTSQRACKPVMTTQAFSRRNQHRAKALCWKSGGGKRPWWCLGIIPSNMCCQFSMISRHFGRNSPLTERRTSSANHLFTLHTAVHADHRETIPILHVKYRAQFLLGVGWGGMSYWVYVTLSCHNWKRNDFRYSGAYFIY